MGGGDSWNKRMADRMAPFTGTNQHETLSQQAGTARGPVVLRVSVIIPTLNEEALIAACIQSAMQAEADEIIVADAGSTDQTTEIAALTASVVVSQPGRAIQQNAGAAQATGDVLLFLHADCRLAPDSIRSIRKALTNAPGTVAGCFWQQIDGAGLKYRLVEYGNAFRARVLKWAYGDQGIFVKSAVFRDISGFPDVKFLEDLLMMKKLKRMGKILMLRNKLVVSARRWESRGVLRQTVRNMALVAASKLGVSPNRLAKFYPNER